MQTADSSSEQYHIEPFYSSFCKGIYYTEQFRFTGLKRIYKVFEKYAELNNSVSKNYIRYKKSCL